jgi:uncharacterized membrane protein
MTTKLEESIEVALPLAQTYALWTDFENFPSFMSNVDSIDVTAPGKLHWKATILGVTREWEAEVSEEIKDERIAWKATEGATNAGVVTFHYIDEDLTKVMLQLDFEPDGLVETIGDKLGFVGAGAEGDLKRFKAYAEGEGAQRAASLAASSEGAGFASGAATSAASATNTSDAFTSTGSPAFTAEGTEVPARAGGDLDTSATGTTDQALAGARRANT